MTKTQVQIPDELYRDAKRIAERYEMSFAEVVRRGLEHMRSHYLVGSAEKNAWEPIKPRNLGWRRDFSPAELKEQARSTASEEGLMTTRKHK